MEQTNEYFTMETLGEFYTKAAKAGGMQYWDGICWSASSSGPNIGNRQSNYRPKQVPVVKYVLKYPDGSTSAASFTFKADAAAWQNGLYKNSKIIKLTEEVS